MLNNPNWNNPVDAMSMDSLISWLEKKPADGTYFYGSSQECLLAQYFRDQGVQVTALGNTRLLIEGEKHCTEIPVGFQRTAGYPFGTRTSDGGQTFGAALERARQLVKSRVCHVVQ